ncbi:MULTISPECIES: universal stress protein [Bartonella]|uniref:universal stress protein n=1 Tax=Bartonella TaxID=773 RepID=UPI001FE9F94F|nr:universal stress protein [Bartonella capreoli]
MGHNIITKPILALIDSSIYAKHVCDLALWAAKFMQTTIRLLHVLDKSEKEISLPNTQQTDNNTLNSSDLKQQDTTLSKALFAQKVEQIASDKKRLGLNFENVVRSSELPIFVASRHFRSIQRILIAFNGGPLIMKAIDFICTRKFFNNLTFVLGMAELQTQAV